MYTSNEIMMLGEILLAVFLGGLVGMERELAGKPAGLRTHMLVAAVSTFLVAMGDLLLLEFRDKGLADLVRADPYRIIGAIVTGLSFIGAGTIIRNPNDEKIEGLTTAASLLFVGAIGISIALQKFILSIGSTLLILIINRGMMVLEKWINKKAKAE
ncbi:MAG: MgtC/SapB family protein [Bacteroidota bacterium]